MNLKFPTSSFVKRRALVLIAGVLTFGIITTTAIRDVFADSEQIRSNQHVLTIHDGDLKNGILTDKHTLREALDEAGVTIGSNDITEPSLDEELLSGSYDINIYRARAVTIVDGNNRSKVMSPYRTAKQIAKQANITLQDEDNVLLEKPTDLLRDGAMERLVIERATKFTLVFYGKKTTSYTQAATVGEMLKSKDISLGEKDKLSTKSETPIKAGMKVEIWREGKQTITEEESVAFPVRQIQDANREVGYRKIKTPGTKGERIATYEVVIKNGKEVSRKEIKSVTTKQPSEQVEIVGSKPSFGGDFAEALEKLRSCEGGYSSWNPAGPYYGAYQFNQQTWNSVSNAPYGSATPAEQDAAARALYERRGWQPWPNCGANLPDTYR